jgi:transaldolase
MNRLQSIRPYGQRIWLDNLSRELIASGTLSRLIEQDGIAGVTSNPTIFHKAISQDDRYRADLACQKAAGLDAEAVYEALVIPDIQAACELFLPMYQASSGDDGYVSLEVSPFLAHDAAGTIAAARRLWAEVDRPNLMIKVPATNEGINAFEKLTSLGININVTLIFSLLQVFHVFQAYNRGLKRFSDSGGDACKVRSVASLFLSRIDTHVDKLPNLDESLKGKTGVALAKIAYQRFLDLFHGEHPRIGHPQKLLWASTGTKNPAYSDLLYVEPLIGRETINTLPEATLDAFLDHGKAEDTLESGVEEAKAHFIALEQCGIDMERVSGTLFEEGLKAFDDAYSDLLSMVA